MMSFTLSGAAGSVSILGRHNPCLELAISELVIAAALIRKGPTEFDSVNRLARGAAEQVSLPGELGRESHVEVV